MSREPRREMRNSLAVAFALSTVVQACGVGPAPDFAAPFAVESWGGYEVLVYDDSGLVTGASAASAWFPDPSGDVVAHPDAKEVQVGWLGGACSHRPTIHITGNATDLEIAIGNPSDPQLIPFLPVSCPAVGIPMVVTLLLSESVEQDAVDVAVNY